MWSCICLTYWVGFFNTPSWSVTWTCILHRPDCRYHSPFWAVGKSPSPKVHWVVYNRYIIWKYLLSNALIRLLRSTAWSWVQSLRVSILSRCGFYNRSLSSSWMVRKFPYRLFSFREVNKFLFYPRTLQIWCCIVSYTYLIFALFWCGSYC